MQKKHNITCKFKRVLIKISGESIQGRSKFGIDINELKRVVCEIKSIVNLGIQVGVVIGGGNIFRGKELVNFGVNKVISDNVGMLSTVINGLVLHDVMRRGSVNVHLMSSFPINSMCEIYHFEKAIRLLNKNHVVIFSGGLGNPFFTTDSAACLRAIEIKADIILKGTQVDGVYSSDPKKNNNSKLYKKITYNEVLRRELKVMDLSAFVLARDYKLPICIFNICIPGILRRIVEGKNEGTLIQSSC
ncbi:uridylate kinase [Buchnera aphidicola (Schlechtendalia chinensis)]|uniref:Uridylate kinase n=1 Tax=Buchnera aphidicola subsp. Schlechtendalia chinensis TaxID=118110 RepID=A0A172WDF0_BUCSC|nr:UMP kinase [Buchnera aphidicola]ANF17009.1 uridylate kinase [Buchnera aphidicola (Schlechtendalia chinensis)]